MKNLLNFYYNLNVSNIHQKNKDYYFSINNDNYLFTICEEKNLFDIYKLNQYLNYNYPFFHQIIVNNNNELRTNINGKNYVLLKLKKDSKVKNYDLNEIIKLNNMPIPQITKQTNWAELWSDKLDYFEYQISQIGKKYPLIRESFNYYLGLGEMAISIVNNTPKSNLYSLSHKRIDDLYNPLNVIIDYRIRDICEYFKTVFFENYNINNELLIFLNNNNLTNTEKNLFIARMIFPTYYFDLYEKIVSQKVAEEELKKIITKVNDYEKILIKIYNHFKFSNNLQIEWLDNIS